MSALLRFPFGDQQNYVFKKSSNQKIWNPQFCLVSSRHATRPARLTCHTYLLLTISGISVANDSTFV